MWIDLKYVCQLGLRVVHVCVCLVCVCVSCVCMCIAEVGICKTVADE